MRRKLHLLHHAGNFRRARDDAGNFRRVPDDAGNFRRVRDDAGNFRRVPVSILVEVDNTMSTPRALE
jgi:hypothetical protein